MGYVVFGLMLLIFLVLVFEPIINEFRKWRKFKKDLWTP